MHFWLLIFFIIPLSFLFLSLFSSSSSFSPFFLLFFFFFLSSPQDNYRSRSRGSCGPRRKRPQRLAAGSLPKEKWGKEKWTRYIFRSLSYRLSANCVSVFAPCYLDGSPQGGLYDFDVFISYFICHHHVHVLCILIARTPEGTVSLFFTFCEILFTLFSLSLCLSLCLSLYYPPPPQKKSIHKKEGGEQAECIFPHYFYLFKSFNRHFLDLLPLCSCYPPLPALPGLYSA